MCTNFDYFFPLTLKNKKVKMNIFVKQYKKLYLFCTAKSSGMINFLFENRTKQLSYLQF